MKLRHEAHTVKEDKYVIVVSILLLQQLQLELQLLLPLLLNVFALSVFVLFLQIADHKNLSHTHQGANLVLDMSTYFLLTEFIKYVRPVVVTPALPSYVFLIGNGGQMKPANISRCMQGFLPNREIDIRQNTVCKVCVRYESTLSIILFL